MSEGDGSAAGGGDLSLHSVTVGQQQQQHRRLASNRQAAAGSAESKQMLVQTNVTWMNFCSRFITQNPPQPIGELNELRNPSFIADCRPIPATQSRVFLRNARRDCAGCADSKVQPWQSEAQARQAGENDSPSLARRVSVGLPRLRVGLVLEVLSWTKISSGYLHPFTGTAFFTDRFLVQRILQLLAKIFTIVYAPKPDLRTFLERSQTQETPLAQVTVAVLSANESRQVLGVPLARRSIQPVFLRITNKQTAPLRLYVLDIDPHYYTPLEAAGINHFSVLKRLPTYGIAIWYFLPLLLLMPIKLYTALRANRRMDDCFRALSFPLRPIPPGETAEGFVYTTLDAGNKTVRVCLYYASRPELGTPTSSEEMEHSSNGPVVDLTFVVPVPGISADYLKRDFAKLYSDSEFVSCDLPDLASRIREMPAATTNSKGSRHGDAVNLVVIGDFETLLSAFTARWDECETITLATCWKTARAFLFGSEYRYSPVSPLFLFGRSQDVALQRIRGSINERLHLRLWLTPLRFHDQPVWVGQISRDIGVRFTTQVWNLTTHRIDPNIDESRDYLVEDLMRVERVHAIGYVGGITECGPENPQQNLTGDPYFTDGQRAVIVLSQSRTSPVNLHE